MGLANDADVSMLERGLRAARSVVDRGCTRCAWPRQRSIEFLRKDAEPNRRVIETDRYISWPGRPDYMTGQLEIQRPAPSRGARRSRST